MIWSFLIYSEFNTGLIMGLKAVFFLEKYGFRRFVLEYQKIPIFRENRPSGPWSGQ